MSHLAHEPALIMNPAQPKTPQTSAPATQYTWAGRFSEPMSELVKRYTASVGFDQRMWRQDIRGSLAHARMLAKQERGTPADVKPTPTLVHHYPASRS